MVDFEKILKQMECPHFEYTWINDNTIQCNKCDKVIVRELK